MRKRLSGILVIVACTSSLSGCAFMRFTGPCFGVGCPSGTPGESSQYKLGEGPKAAPPQAQAQAQPPQKKAGDPGKNPTPGT
ncbi:MAG: hypothetical protein WA823_14315 [Candidatus Acidiferrales bacterium]